MARRRRGKTPRPGKGKKQKKSKKGASAGRGSVRLAPISAFDRALATFLQVPVDPRAGFEARMRAALDDPEVMRAAVSRLDRPSRDVFWDLTVTGGARPEDTAARLALYRGVTEKRALEACDHVAGHAIAVHCSDACDELHVVVACQPLILDGQANAAGVLEPGPDPLPFGFRVALVAAYAAQNQPGLTKDGRVYVRWLRKALEVFDDPSMTGPIVESIVWMLCEFGALVPDDEQSTKVMHLDVASAVDIVSSSSMDLILALLRLERWRPLGVAGVALAALERASRDVDAVTLGDVHESVLDLGALPWKGRHPRAEYVRDTWETAYAVGLLRSLGGASVEYDGERISVARLDEEEPEREGWTVLPNLDVLVPERADPADVVRLGCVAELVNVDRVSTFRLDRKSVQRAKLLLARHDAESVTELLATTSSRPVPDNVVANVRSWLAGGTAVRSFVGAVIVVPDPDQAAVVRAKDPEARQVSEGVFALDPTRLPKVLRALEKAGHVVAPTTRTDGDGHTTQVPSGGAASSAELERDDLERWATARFDDDPFDVEPVSDDSPQAAKLDALLAEGADVLDLLNLLEPDKLEMLLDMPLSMGKAYVEAVRELMDSGALDEQLESGDEPSDADPGAGGRLLRFSAEGPDPEVVVSFDGPAEPESNELWETLTLGPLRARLRDVALAGGALELLYRTKPGGVAVRPVLPIELGAAKHREFVTATDIDAGVVRRFYLDRISAVRPATR